MGEVEAAKQALASAMAPYESAYKYGQATKAMTEAGLAGRETKVKELGVDPTHQRALEYEKAAGKGRGELEAAEADASRFDLVPLPKELAETTGITSYGQMMRLAKSNPVISELLKSKGDLATANIHADAVRYAADVNAKSKTELANMRADDLMKYYGALTNLLKLQAESLALTPEMQKALDTAKQASDKIKEAIDAKAGPSAAGGSQLTPADHAGLKSRGLTVVRETPTGVVVRNAKGVETTIPFVKKK